VSYAAGDLEASPRQTGSQQQRGVHVMMRVCTVNKKLSWNGFAVCVGCLFFKDTEPSPLQDSSSVRQQGGLPGPPPVVPDPESVDSQASPQ
jgi:hypothetical protein